jgi:integrase
VADGTYIGGITGKIDGRPWRGRPITVQELPTLVRPLYAAAFIVTCYLSGMRPGEVLNLPRGCRDADELLIRGQRGKGYDRTPLPGDTEDRHRPWVVAVPVHATIAILEDLYDGPLLFPASLVYAHKTRPGEFNARQSQAMTVDIDDFISWVNASFAALGSAAAIPAGRSSAAGSAAPWPISSFASRGT